MAEQLKSGYVAMIGRPNVGKSTLMNHLIGQKIAITSRKPQTTRNRIRTVYNDARGQIVFLDTPGIHKAKNRLGEYMVDAAEKSLKDVDAVLWLIEPGDYVGAAEQHIARLLGRSGLPVILVINKTDRCRKEEVAKTMEAYRGLCRFSDTVAVSALHSTNLDLVLDAVFAVLPVGPRFFDEDTVTDQPVRQIAAEMIREKALRSMGQEIPHGIAVVIEKMRERPDGSVTDIEAVIICERESHKGIIIGKNGAMLKKIGTEARQDIEKMLDGHVNLKLWVKVRKDWRESDILLKNYGYDKKEL
ncbi:MAG TPA: GTPase Era [Lachnospiraceae bacterium]|jgi:GTP-binding protein Era|nr:GTPase Era [Eubacterium sp.]MDD6684550.1 GTPase Era [Lachnospiraceae bacterium]HBB61822.1 GTPase Era [Lachnospiraceae bacterium]